MKQKKLPTRKRQALRRIALALVVLLAVNHWSNSFFLLPYQAVRDNEETYGLYDTKVIKRLWMKELVSTDLIYLTAEKKAMMLSFVEFDFPMGWESWSVETLDCSAGDLFYAGRAWRRTKPNDDGEQELHHVFFGKLNSWDIKKLTISIVYDNRDGETVEKRLEMTDFIEKDDERYFLMETVLEDVPENDLHMEPITATACNVRGEAIAEKEVTA